MSTINIKLDDPMFEYVKHGIKTYEGQRNIIKTKTIKPEDVLLISHNTKMGELPYHVLVKEIRSFPSFKHAFFEIGFENCIPNVTNIDEACEIYNRFIPEEQQEKEGIILFSISRNDSKIRELDFDLEMKILNEKEMNYAI